jgi:hypothetical protein
MPGGQLEVKPFDDRPAPRFPGGRVLVADRLEPDPGDRPAGRADGAGYGPGAQPGDDLVQVRHGGEHLLERDVGRRHPADLRRGQEHRQHDRDRAQRDRVLVGGQAQRPRADHVHRGHDQPEKQRPVLELAQLRPRPGHAVQPGRTVPGQDPVPQPEHPDLLGEGRPVRTAQVIPAVPQLRRGPAGQRRPGRQHLAQRRPDRGPAHEEQQPHPPAERRQRHTGQEAAQPVPERAGQRHRGIGRPGRGQLAAGRGQLVKHRRVLEVLNAFRLADRAGQPPLHARAHRRRAVRLKQRFHRAAQQRQPVGHGPDDERDQQRVPARRPQSVLHGGRDLPDRPAERHQRHDREEPLGEHVQHHRGGQAAAGVGNQPRDPQPWRRCPPSRQRGRQRGGQPLRDLIHHPSAPEKLI